MKPFRFFLAGTAICFMVGVLLIVFVFLVAPEKVLPLISGGWDTVLGAFLTLVLLATLLGGGAGLCIYTEIKGEQEE